MTSASRTLEAGLCRYSYSNLYSGTRSVPSVACFKLRLT